MAWDHHENEEQGIYILNEGTCKIVHILDGLEAKELKRGDIFGECDLLKTIGYNYYGDIVVSSE